MVIHDQSSWVKLSIFLKFTVLHNAHLGNILKCLVVVLDLKFLDLWLYIFMLKVTIMNM